jgi:hypothetical protein
MVLLSSERGWQAGAGLCRCLNSCWSAAKLFDLNQGERAPQHTRHWGFCVKRASPICHPAGGAHCCRRRGAPVDVSGNTGRAACEQMQPLPTPWHCVAPTPRRPLPLPHANGSRTSCSAQMHTALTVTPPGCRPAEASWRPSAACSRSEAPTGTGCTGSVPPVRHHHKLAARVVEGSGLQQDGLAL